MRSRFLFSCLCRFCLSIGFASSLRALFGSLLLPQLCQLFGIVEYEDGQVSEVYPNKILFLDNKLAGYDFTEKEGAGNAAD